MSLEADLVTVIKTVIPRVFPDTAPTLTPTPYATYQQIGGDPSFYYDGAVMDQCNALVQINIWAETRLQANQLMRELERVLLQAPAIQAVPSGALRASHDSDTDLRGAEQDFSIWATR